jgi:RHS repeat-associated protein
VTYTYDPSNSRVATMVDGIGTTSYNYKAAAVNGAGQVATVDGPLSNDTIAYTYDELGRVIQRTINGSANQVDWTFDALGRVSSEENLLGEFTYAYDGATNRLATVSYPNGQTSVYSYLGNEADHRLQTIHHRYPNESTLSKFDYTYDAGGNILTSRQQADTTAVVWKYGYDAANQLTSAVKHATDTSQTILQRFAYAYDPAGNRTVEQIDDSVTLSAYDRLNRLTSQAPGGPLVIMGTLNEPGTVAISGVPLAVDSSNNFSGTVPTVTGTNAFTIVARDLNGNTTSQHYEVDLGGAGRTFSYDANGNLITDGTRTFEWDARNLAVSILEGGFRTDRAFSGTKEQVRRIDRMNGSVVDDQASIWCGPRVCEERGWNSSTPTRIVAEFGEQLGSASRFVFHDQLGSVRAITDTSAVVQTRLDYDPWGNPSYSGTDQSLLTYAKQHGDRSFQVGFTLHRAYDPAVGRWLSEDPAGHIDGPNKYSYVRNQPTRLVDPLGLCGCGSECPSGQWQMDTIGGNISGYVGGAAAGFGRVRCVGKPWVGRLANVYCGQMGAVLGAGFSFSVQVQGTVLSGPCNRSELREFRTESKVVELDLVVVPAVSINGDTDLNSFGLGIGASAFPVSAYYSPCRVVPR